MELILAILGAGPIGSLVPGRRRARGALLAERRRGNLDLARTA